MRLQLLHQTRAIRHAVGALDADLCLGTALLERDTEHITHLGEVDVNVPPEHRRRGIGTMLVDHVSQVTAQVGVTTLLSEVTVIDENSPGLAFAHRHGFDSVHTENRMVLDLPLPPGRLAELGGTSDAAGHGYTVASWSVPTSAEHLPAMAQLKTGMNAEVPTGNVDAHPEVIAPVDLGARERRLHDAATSC